jgi:hypothetical protein
MRRHIHADANGSLFVEIAADLYGEDVKTVKQENVVSALQRLPPWQVRATALITLLGPPTASLILLALDYFEYWRAVPFNFADFLVAFFLFAIPVGYAFGTVPALLAASRPCALLTVNSRLLQRRLLIRACMGAVCGGLASWVWFGEWLTIAWGIYWWVRSSWLRCRWVRPQLDEAALDSMRSILETDDERSSCCTRRGHGDERAACRGARKMCPCIRSAGSGRGVETKLFAALEGDDLKAWEPLTDPDFVAYESGQRYSRTMM